jgi:hypothetical protein
MISYTLPKDDPGEKIWVTDLLVDDDRNVWVGTANSGAFRFDGKDWTRYADKDGLTTGCYGSVLDFPKGLVWTDIPCDPSKLLLFNGEVWQPYWFDDAPIEMKYIDDIEVGPGGVIWLTAGCYLYRYDGVNWIAYPHDRIADVFRSACGIRIKAAPDGSFWVSSLYSLDLIHFLSVDSFEVLRVPELVFEDMAFSVMYVSQDGSVWIGTESSVSEPGGIKNLLLQWDGSRWTVYDQLPFNSRLFVGYRVSAIATTLDGTVWVATAMGIYRFKPEE